MNPHFAAPEKLCGSKEEDMRAVLFVDQPKLRSSLGRDLSLLGLEVLLPTTLEEARRTLVPLPLATDLFVTNWSEVDGTTSELLDAVARSGHGIQIILMTDRTEAATVYDRFRIDEIVVLPSEPADFAGSVHRLFGPEALPRLLADTP